MYVTPIAWAEAEKVKTLLLKKSQFRLLKSAVQESCLSLSQSHSSRGWRSPIGIHGYTLDQEGLC
jgi:hypothetical protein